MPLRQVFSSEWKICVVRSKRDNFGAEFCVELNVVCNSNLAPEEVATIVQCSSLLEASGCCFHFRDLLQFLTLERSCAAELQLDRSRLVSPRCTPNFRAKRFVLHQRCNASRRRRHHRHGARSKSRRAAGCARDPHRTIEFREPVHGFWQQRAVRLQWITVRSL